MQRSLLTEHDRVEISAICGDLVRFDEPLAPFTSWKIGGPA
ncbi:MAG: UDP-N-acetylenolpyruvoylglucosamine reductase, partial [Candidatus Eremiobacteraeota bacterium]|nr:UDP-N-acetylenolpyruvoylglucosamine reductase [Candidatus Eremiobacteraeota bacterium]